MSNPFFAPLPESGVPQFDAIRLEHYQEAFDRGFAEHRAEIDAIVSNPAPASFENSIEAMERAGELLRRVGSVFFNLTSSNTSDELQALESEIVPRYAAHFSRIYTNTALYARAARLREQEESLGSEQVHLLNEICTAFERAGAALDEQARGRVADIDERLASLTTRFGQNLLKDTNAYEMVLEDEAELAGLPEFVRAAARSEAEARGKSGKYVFTISRSSVTPFLQYAVRRDLREQIYRAYTDAGHSIVDNYPVIEEIIALRAERARLLGFETHADYMLDDRMAKTPDNVLNLLDQVWEPAQRKVRKEAEDLQQRIQDEGSNFELAPWDWWYYTQKIRQERFDLDEEVIKPYFRLEQVRDGAFEVARKLYGITFHARSDIPVYHPDVQAFEVKDADDSLVGIFMFDFFMRPSKRGGAWMNTFRDQSAMDGHEHPVVVNCCNFPKSNPCLLGMDEVRTLFHEFGHGLHGLLSKVCYRSLGGTNVKQDFVELPSQIMEHWAIERDVLKEYARHYETGEPMPDELIEKLKAAETFNQGFATTEYLAACYLDMAWHSERGEQATDVAGFEADAMNAIDLVPMVDPRYKSSYFQHIFSGSHYSAGYYVYMWAEVLDADGFEAFKENGIFDPETARSFRENILEKGGTVDAMTLYRQFRGREPDVQPLLKNRGMV